MVQWIAGSTTTKRQKTSEAKSTSFPLRWLMVLVGLLLIFGGVTGLLINVSLQIMQTKTVKNSSNQINQIFRYTLAVLRRSV